MIVLDVLGAGNLFDGVHVGARLSERNVAEYGVATEKPACTSGIAGRSLRHGAGWIKRVISKIKTLGASPSSSEPFARKLLIRLSAKLPLAVSSALVALAVLVAPAALTLLELR